MKYLKTLVIGKEKQAIEGVEYSGQMYHAASQTLKHDFGRTELILDAQLRKIHAYPFISLHDSLEIVKFSQVISGCVNVLTQTGYKLDTGSESVLNSVARKLPNELKNKWLPYFHQNDVSYKSM